MDRKTLRSLIVGPIATVPTPFDKNYRADYGRMHELTQYWVDNGILKGKGVIKVAAAMGEGPMLDDDEARALLSTTVNAAQDKAAIVFGLHFTDTLRTIRNAKAAQDIGAIGLQISPPIHSHPTQDDILRHFDAVSKAIDIGIMIYHTHWMPAGRIEVPTIKKLADMEKVVAFKWNHPEDVPFEAMKEFSDKLNVIDNTNTPVKSHMLGGKGFVNETMAAYPPHDLKVQALMDAGKLDEAQKLWDSVVIPIRAFYERTAGVSGGEGRTIKGMIHLLGHSAGVSRPPSLPLSDFEMDELRKLLVSFGWPVKS